jgi:hypothetical protein
VEDGLVEELADHDGDGLAFALGEGVRGDFEWTVHAEAGLILRRGDGGGGVGGIETGVRGSSRL